MTNWKLQFLHTELAFPPLPSRFCGFDWILHFCREGGSVEFLDQIVIGSSVLWVPANSYYWVAIGLCLGQHGFRMV